MGEPGVVHDLLQFYRLPIVLQAERPADKDAIEEARRKPGLAGKSAVPDDHPVLAAHETGGTGGVHAGQALEISASLVEPLDGLQEPFLIRHPDPAISFHHDRLQVLGAHDRAEPPAPQCGRPIHHGQGPSAEGFPRRADGDHAGPGMLALQGIGDGGDPLSPKLPGIDDLYGIVPDMQVYGAGCLSPNEDMVKPGIF